MSQEVRQTHWRRSCPRNDEARNQNDEGMTNAGRPFGIRHSFGFLVSDFVMEPIPIPFRLPLFPLPLRESRPSPLPSPFFATSPQANRGSSQPKRSVRVFRLLVHHSLFGVTG